MTRNIIKIAFVSALTLGSLTACDLDINPEGQSTTDLTWKLMTDAEHYENGLYASFRGIWGDLSTEYQSDLFNACVGFGNNGGPEQRWTFTDESSVWSNNYNTIKECNHILNNIDKIDATGANDSTTTANKTELANIKGEAYFIRAICYHNIAIRYAKDYEAATAAQDPGLPLVTTVDINNKPNRSSLKDTYDFIKKDIAEARQLLTNNDPGSNQSKLTSDDINLFEARVDLYMDNYSEADQLAQKVIQSGKYPLATSQEAFNKIWTDDQGSEIMFQPAASVEELPASKGDVFLAYSSSLSEQVGAPIYQPYFIPTATVLDMYESGDYRAKAFFVQKYVYEGNMSDIEKPILLNKFPGNDAYKKSVNEVSYYNTVKVFRSAEAYLISAEARYKANNPSGAVAVLNQLRTARGESATTATGTALFQAIKDEWTREFIGEGYRLDNLKRWHEGFNGRTSQKTSAVVGGDGYTNLQISADNYRFVWEIPSNDRLVNKDLVPNWDSNKK